MTPQGVSASQIEPGMIIRLRNCNCFHEVTAVDANLDPDVNPRAIIEVTLPHGQQHFFRASDWVEIK